MREMKDSGIEWIGKIPNTWKLSKIGQVYTERKTRVSDRDYPPLSVTMKGILPQLDTAAKTDAHDDRKLLCKGDFAINSRSDRRGSCGISPVDGSISLINIVLQPKEKMDSQYYEWMFHSSMFSDEFYKWGHGIVDDLWTTGWQDMKRIAIPVPDLLEQKRIAMFLNEQCGELDNVLVKTRASIEEYKKLKQAVITQAVTKGIRGSRKTKDSGIEWLGSIPANWNLIKITRLLDYGHSYPIGDGDHGLIKTDDYIDLGVPYIRVQNLGWGTELNYDNLVYISEERNQMIANSILKPNDILFAKTGATIGKTAIIPDSIPVSNTTSHIGKITVSSNYNPRFVFYVMSSYVVYRQFWEMAGLKTTRPELSIDEIKKIRIAIPSTLEEQDSIVKYLDRICKNLDKLINKKESYIAEIENYKKSFIYEYVTGKKEVPDT